MPEGKQFCMPEEKHLLMAATAAAAVTMTTLATTIGAVRGRRVDDSRGASRALLFASRGPDRPMYSSFRIVNRYIAETAHLVTGGAANPRLVPQQPPPIQEDLQEKSQEGRLEQFRIELLSRSFMR